MTNGVFVLPTLTRLEVIDWRKGVEGGRVFVHKDPKSTISLDFQDDGRTVKIFIKDREEIDK